MTDKCDATQGGRYRAKHASGLSRRSMLRGGLAAFGLGSLSVAAGTAGYVWWEEEGSRGEANADAHKMVDDLHEQWSKHPATTSDPDPASLNPGQEGTAFATIAIPRFGATWLQPVIQGTTLAELGVGVGHVPGTAMPGQIGNFGLAGHRTTHGRPFNKIAELRKNDPIIVTTDVATYTYAAGSHEVVTPNEASVFDPVPHKPNAKQTKAIITLSSCHPFYSARERYVVYGTLVKTQHR